MKSADDIRMGGTWSKLDDEIRAQINFYRLEMAREQLERVQHGQGKGPLQGEALGEKSGWRQVHETKTGPFANVVSMS